MACYYLIDQEGEVANNLVAVINESSDHWRSAALTCINIAVNGIERSL